MPDQPDEQPREKPSGSWFRALGDRLAEGMLQSIAYEDEHPDEVDEERFEKSLLAEPLDLDEDTDRHNRTREIRRGLRSKQSEDFRDGDQESPSSDDPR